MKIDRSRRVVFCALASLYILLNGCASIKNAPISDKITSVTVANESVGYVTLKVGNAKNKNYQPNIKYAFIWEDAKSDRKKYSFNVLDPYNKMLVEAVQKHGYTQRQIAAHLQMHYSTISNLVRGKA